MRMMKYTEAKQILKKNKIKTDNLSKYDIEQFAKGIKSKQY